MPQILKRKAKNPSGPRKTLRLEGEAYEKRTESTVNETESDSDNIVDDDQNEEDLEVRQWNGIDTNSSVLPPGNFQTDRKPPTRDELRNIKEASDLFKSSSFKLQIDALLPNVRPKPSRIQPLERFLFSLHSFMQSLPSVEPLHPLEASRKLRETGVEVPYPLPLPTEDTKWKVAFEAPSDITLVGSWANKISVKAKDERKYGVDVAVEMPSNLFQEKDYLNGRFFHKRAYYMAILASAIRKSNNLSVDVAYQSQGEDCRLTKLVLTPINDGSSTNFARLNAEICILPVLSTNSPIPLHRLSPNQSNLRVATTDENAENKGEALRSSPLYNNALLRTLAPKHQLLTIHSLQNDCPTFADALTLLRIWANQRGYGVGTRACVRGFEGSGSWWPCILALLLCGEESREGQAYTSGKRSVGKGLSSYQLFKAALEFLAKHEFKEAIFLKTNEGHRFLPEEFMNHHEAVFLDSSLANHLTAIPLGSLDLLRYDAEKTLEMLNQPTFSGDLFTEVFLKDSRDLWTRFDVILGVKLTSAKLKSPSIHSTIDAGSPAAALLSAIDSLLRRGLGTRCRAVTILHPSSSSRPTSQAHPSTPDSIYIGIIYNTQDAFRLVDHGPAVDDQNTAALEEFKELWGNESELRRFKDGRILESVVWEVGTADERGHVPSRIVRHLLERHFSIRENAIETWQSSFDAMLRLPSIISREYLSTGSSTGFKGALSAFDNLVKNIKSVDKDLPLSVLMVSPVSESLRYTSVLSPVPLPATLAAVLPPNARYLPTIEVVLEFEKSSRWPDDLKAIQTIKLAFFERIATALMESVDGLIAKVVTGDGIHDSPILDQSFLEIITPDGWAFNAHVSHDREIHLLDRIIDGTASRLPHVVPKNKEHKKTKEYHDALEAKAVHLRRFIHAPRHHRAIAALCHQYSAFSGTVRLVKRWLASHWLLDSHISEEAVEIICASFFVHKGRPLTVDIDQTAQHLVPGSKERGFATVVKFLKDWKWEQGLFVPLYGEASSMTPNESILAGRGGVWRVCSEHDPEGNMWTCNGPDLVAANRVTSLATATWGLLQQGESGRLDIHGLFVHPTDDYDFIVELEPLVLPRYLQNVLVDANLLVKQGKYANRTVSGENLSILPGFDPAKLLSRGLQRTYSDTFKIFYDPLGGDKFGAVWDPTLKTSRTFRVLGGFSSMPIHKVNDQGKDKDLVILNKSSVIAEVQRMGLGIIKKIIVAT